MLVVSAGASAIATFSESRDAVPEAPQCPLISAEVCQLLTPKGVSLPAPPRRPDFRAN